MSLKIPSYKKMSIKNDIVIYNKPAQVYIPLANGRDLDITALVKKGEYVYKGDIIGKSKGNFRVPILSSVSGRVVDFEEKQYQTGDKVRCVVIENDFKEETSGSNEVRKKIDDYTKEEFINLIQDRGIIGMGGSGFPTYVKYDTDKKIKTLIINAVECEPYITADYALIKQRPEEILEAIDAILKINNIDEAIIAIKKTNASLKRIFDNYIGTYLKIKIVLVPNLYPMGWERTLIKQVKKLEYQNLPIEQGIVVNNISTIYAMYQAMKMNKPLIERIVTFTGEGLKKPVNVLVKTGTSASEVIKEIGGFSKEDIMFIVGGPMMGTGMPSKDIIITGNINCILVIKNYEGLEEVACLRCGKCNVCPAKLSPVLIKDNLKNIEELRKLEPSRCVECGLCSYVCPAKIQLREKVIEAKNKVK